MSKAELRAQLAEVNATKLFYVDAWRDEHNRRHALEGELVEARAEIAALRARLGDPDPDPAVVHRDDWGIRVRPSPSARGRLIAVH